MELYGNTLCVSYTELVGEGIISKPYYDKLKREGTLSVVRGGGNGRTVLISYHDMPERIKKVYDTKNPNALKEIARMKEERYISETIKFDGDAVAFYKAYTSSNGSSITPAKQLEYILNAQVMNEMIRAEKASSLEHRKAGHYRPKLAWGVALETCERLRSITGHTLPVNAARLREKFNEYKKNGYISLVSGKIGNQTARIIGKAEGALLLKLKRSKFPVYDDMQILKEYNKQAELRGMKTIASAQTVKNFLYDNKIRLYWFSSVHGEIAWKSEFMPTQDTVLPEMPNALWYSDGTKLNLYYKAYDEKRKKMVMRTTDVYEVMDAATEVFLGHCIADGENFYTQYIAYREAIMTYRIKPYEIVTDNQGGHKKNAALGFYQKICHLHKTTMPHNGQSKSIESAFGRFQKKVLHQMYEFTGMNVTAKKLNSRANIELLTRNIDMLPTLEELKEKYAKARQEWNNSEHTTSPTGLTRMELHNAIRNPKAHKVTDREAKEIFMLFSNESIKYSKEGFVFVIKGQEYRYMVYDAEGLVDMNFHLQSVGDSFHYRYDPEDMTSVELYKVTTTGMKFAAVATPKVSIHRATQERTEEENEYLYKQLKANERTKAAQYLATEDLARESDMSEAFLQLRTPRPVGLSNKKLDAYRKEMASGQLAPAVPAPCMEVPDAPAAASFASAGDYTKQVSNMVFDEINFYDKY
ncbi:MAG: hypothetical protein ACRCUJ_01615 [Phocaeicola sp.]